MKVYPCGTEVVIEQAGIQGRVTAITERFGQVTYEVTYFMDGNPFKVPCMEKELRVFAGVKKASIGYK